MPCPWSATSSVPVGEPDRDRAERRAPLGGVVEQVGDRALQGGGVADDPPRLGVQVELQAAGPAAYPLHRPLGDLGEVDLLQRERPPARRGRAR